MNQKLFSVQGFAMKNKDKPYVSENLENMILDRRQNFYMSVPLFPYIF